MHEIEQITRRRSIRSFSDKPIPERLLATLLESIRWSPSWGNSQCWEVIAVTDYDLRTRLRETLSARNPALLAVQKAPLVIAMCGARGKAGFYNGNARTHLGDWLLFDLGLATQNLVLAAHCLGLGSVIVGGMDQKKAGNILKVPSGFELVCLVPIGYPAQTPSPPKRRQVKEFTHHEYFTTDDKTT